MPDHGLINSGHVRVGLSSHVADTDGVGLASNALVADVDVVVARGEIQAGAIAQGDITAASVIKKRTVAIGHVVAAGSVAIKCLSAVGHVAAAGCVASERLPTSGRVRAAGCATKERRITSGRVPDAGGEAEERKITLSGVGIGISSVGGWDNP